MRGALVCGPLALLFLASVLSTNAQKAAAGEAQVAVAAGAPLLVECPLRVEQRAEWRLDGGALPADVSASEAVAAATGEGLTARLRAAAAGPRHAGVYTCASGPQAARVRVRLLPAPGSESPASSMAPPALPGEAAPVLYYDVRGPLSLDCSGLTDDPAATLVWTKNDTLLENIPELRDRYKLSAAAGVERALFNVTGRSSEEDFGNYSCAWGGVRRAWQVRGRPHAKLPSDTSVVEGQKLKITCKLVGKPYPPVAWSYSNDTLEGNATGADVRSALGPRVSLRASEQGVADAELVLEPAARADAGRLTCAPLAEGAGAVPAATTLRVKDMYAALWPFLGICAEVFVLCAVILIYEKRRTKPELDDSDTDNHDQKKS